MRTSKLINNNYIDMTQADYWFLVVMGVVVALVLILLGIIVGYVIGRNISDIETMSELRMLRKMQEKNLSSCTK